MDSSAACIEREILSKAHRLAMKTVACLLLAVLFPPPVTVAAQQTGTLRCSNGIVSINDTIPDVLTKCGPPAFQDRREDARAFGKRHDRTFETITVDAWTYNFGPQEFMYEVTFHNGRVAKIESLNQGY
jgi:hypothetical protein